jgi:hypothetical protein
MTTPNRSILRPRLALALLAPVLLATAARPADAQWLGGNGNGVEVYSWYGSSAYAKEVDWVYPSTGYMAVYYDGASGGSPPYFLDLYLYDVSEGQVVATSTARTTAYDRDYTTLFFVQPGHIDTVWMFVRSNQTRTSWGFSNSFLWLTDGYYPYGIWGTATNPPPNSGLGGR